MKLGAPIRFSMGKWYHLCGGIEAGSAANSFIDLYKSTASGIVR